MSKTFRSFPLVFAAAVLILQLFNNSRAQDLRATITIDAKTPNIARVKGRFLTKRMGAQVNSLSFLSQYAGTTGLQDRISEVRVGDGPGDIESVPTADRISYMAVSEFREWSYAVDLTAMKNAAAAAHVSSMSPDGGVLMMDDLLPQEGGRSARVKIDLPAGWKLYAASAASGENEFDVPDLEKAAFYVSRNWRETRLSLPGGPSINLLVSGEWMFSDEEATAAVREVFLYYKKLFGSPPKGNFQIAIVKLPAHIPPGNWEGDTRGSTITIASSDMPFRSASLQRLHEQFRHEIFHLWVPGGVTLTGNYSWFYEGFALYQSLKMGVEVNRIRFDDMLDTLSRAYQIDRRMGHMRQPRSLIDLSRERWDGAGTQVYARGMLVAFLCDLALLDASGGKRSNSDLLRDIYSQQGGAAPARPGNETLVAVFRSHRELVPIVERYVSGGADIDWQTALRAAGLETEGQDEATKLKAVAKPTGRQKHLLDKLGYNNWRKLSTGTK